MCCYGQHTVFNRKSAQKPSMQTVTHVITYDLFFFFQSVKREHLQRSQRAQCTAYTPLHPLLVFLNAQIANHDKNTGNILIAASQHWSQCRSGLKQSAPSPPDWQYIVIHCTPAAGSVSPSPLCRSCSHSWHAELPPPHQRAQTSSNSVSRSATLFGHTQGSSESNKKSINESKCLKYTKQDFLTWSLKD